MHVEDFMKQKLCAMKTIVLFLLLIQFGTVLSFLPGHVKLGSRLSGLGRARTKIDQPDGRNRFTCESDKSSPKFSATGSPQLQNDLGSSTFNIFSTQRSKIGASGQIHQKLAFLSEQRNTKKSMHVKMDFYSTYTNPIESHYTAFLSNLMSTTFTQTTHELYAYDALQAFGLCTQYYTIMKEYALSDQVEPIFDTMLRALSMDPQQLKSDATRLLRQVDATRSVSDQGLFSSESELGEVFQKVRENEKFHYTDAWGVGLGRLLELRQSTTNRPDFARWSELLIRVPAERMEQSWSNFSEQQSRIQSFEATRKEKLRLCVEPPVEGHTRSAYGGARYSRRQQSEFNQRAELKRAQSGAYANLNSAMRYNSNRSGG